MCTRRGVHAAPPSQPRARPEAGTTGLRANAGLSPSRWAGRLGILILALACVASALAAGSEVGVLDFPHNGTGLRHLVAPIAVDLRDLAVRYARVRGLCPAESPLRAVDARRLISRRDWSIAEGKVPCEPWNVYGSATLAAWFHTVQWLMDRPAARPLTPGLLREIHRRVTSGHPFAGYVRRRVLARARTGALKDVQARSLLARLARGDLVAFDDIDPRTLPGAFRSENLDTFVHSGESVLPDGRRYLVTDEITRLRANRLFCVDDSSLTPLAPGRLFGQVNYLPPARVAAAVDLELDRFNRFIERARGPAEVVRLTVQLSRALVSVHPFVDGNGRAIRLLVDFILQHHGLPPPLYPNELDMMMTDDEAVNYTLRAMVAYVEAMEGALFPRTRSAAGAPGCR